MKFKPKDLATILLTSSSRRRLVEIISNPIPARRFVKPETIMVRMVPGEQTTIAEVAVSDLEVPKLNCIQRYCHIAEVDRKGFPLNVDMLRYDNAALYNYQEAEDGFLGTEPILIYRVSDSKRSLWTISRWNSSLHTIRPVLVRDLQTEKILTQANE